MSTTIQRPSFFFGQYLGADDLQALLDHSRGQMARHERYLHTPGIAGGLALVETGTGETLGIKYKLLAIQDGVAIDGYGREIVVADDQPLDISEFKRQGVFVKDAWHPVFLQTAWTTPPPAALDPRSCDSSEPKRVNEGFEIVFGRPGDETRDPPPAAAFDSGADDGPAPWQILLGFVKFDNTIDQFTDLASSANGIGRRYAGALADEVVARGGTLTLRSKPVTENDAPAIVVNAADPDRFFVLGKQTNGLVQPLVTVSSSGNLIAEGSIDAKKGSVRVDSGVLSHGMPVPLPAGISETDVTNGSVVLHVHVTTKVPAVTPSTTTLTVPVECGVSANRIVTCRVGTFTPGTAGITFAPGLCDYTIVAVAV
jgi:hypothetical protein